MKKHAAFFVLLVLFGCHDPDEVAFDAFSHLTILVDQYAESAIKKNNITSLSLAIYSDGLTYRNHYGHVHAGVPNTPNDRTLYEVASVSKVFVGSLAAKAVAEGKISLGDDVRKYLKGDFSNLDYEGVGITVRDLVTHTLGFKTPPGFSKLYKSMFTGSNPGRAATYRIDSLITELKTVVLDTTPGTVYSYSNVGPELMAYVLEQVYDKPYPDLLQGLFTDMSMRDSKLYRHDSTERKRMAKGYDKRGDPAPVFSNPLPGGAGGIVAPLPDLVDFMKFQVESRHPLVKESTRYLFEDGENDTGYFWDLGEGDKEGFYYMKSGSSVGTESIILICPESQYGIVLLMNNQSEAALDDFATLYNRIESDLMEYPKINLWSSVESDFFKQPGAVDKKYDMLREQGDRYFTSPSYLNGVGYEYIYAGKMKKAIQVFTFAIAKFPEDANLYDSLGELYFHTGNYNASRINYEKSLRYNPANQNAKTYLLRIDTVSDPHLRSNHYQ